MAVWSEVPLRVCQPRYDFAAEHYHPRKLQYTGILHRLPGTTVGTLSGVVRQLFDRQRSPLPSAIRFYDLNDALGGFLGEGKSSSTDAFESTKKVARGGDVVISRLRSYLREVAVVPPGIGDILCSTEFIVLRPHDSDTAYALLPFLLSDYVQTILNWSQDGSEHPRFSDSSLLEIPVPDVVLAEQEWFRRAIGQAVEHMCNSRALYSEAQALLVHELGLDQISPAHQISYERSYAEVTAAGRLDAEYFQPAAVELLTRVRRLSCFALRRHADVGSGYPWDSTHFVDNTQPGEPFVRIRDCKPGAIDVDELDRLANPYAKEQGQSRAQAGHILVGMDGLKWFYGGLVTQPCYVNQRVAWVRQHPDCPVSPEYMMLVINSRVGQAQLLREMTIAHTVGHITNETVRGLLIPLVASDLQDEITSLIRSSHSAHYGAKAALEDARRRVTELIQSASGYFA